VKENELCKHFNNKTQEKPAFYPINPAVKKRRQAPPLSLFKNN
jgi:hypothetical protein